MMVDATGHLVYDSGTDHLVSDIQTVYCTFVGNITAVTGGGTPVIFNGGKYQCDWNGSAYQYLIFPRIINVRLISGVWNSRIEVNGGPSYGAGTIWVRTPDRFGAYTYSQSIFIGPGESDNVTAVSVSIS